MSAITFEHKLRALVTSMVQTSNVFNPDVDMGEVRTFIDKVVELYREDYAAVTGDKTLTMLQAGIPLGEQEFLRDLSAVAVKHQTMLVGDYEGMVYAQKVKPTQEVLGVEQRPTEGDLRFNLRMKI